MEESGKIVQQKKVENSDPEDENPGNSTVRSHSTEGNTHYMVFTYFKGDINSKVDEHFSRALQQSSTPTDSNSKRKTHNIEPKRDEKQSRHQWSPPAQMWSSPYRGPSLSSVPMSSASVPMPVSQYRPDSHQNLRQQPHDPWLLPSVSRQSLDANIYHQPMPELHRMMPAAVSNRQYSSLLVPLRGERAATESNQQQTAPKSNLTPTWTAPDPELTEMRPSVNPDIGFQHPQRRKDIYWY